MEVKVFKYEVEQFKEKITRMAEKSRPIRRHGSKAHVGSGDADVQSNDSSAYQGAKDVRRQ